MVKTTYNEIQDLMASITTLSMDAWLKYKRGQLSEEKMSQIINITNVSLRNLGV